MSSQFLSGVKALHSKYLKSDTPSFNSSLPLENQEIVSNHPDVLLWEAYKEIALSQSEAEAFPYLSSLYNYFSGNPLKEADDFDAEIANAPEVNSDGEEDSLENLDLPDGQETFSNKYPEVDLPSLLERTYNDWILGIKGKPFYKTIRSYYEIHLSGSLNFLDREFLWKLLKAISSCITHLLIEGEQKEEALCLIEKYYDSLIQCLNSVIHAADREDVVSSFNYMVDFLGISKEFAKEGDNLSEDEFK